MSVSSLGEDRAPAARLLADYGYMLAKPDITGILPVQLPRRPIRPRTSSPFEPISFPVAELRSGDSFPVWDLLASHAGEHGVPVPYRLGRLNQPVPLIT